MGKSCVVVGAGESGLAAAELLLSRGASVTVNDRRTRAELGERASRVEGRARFVLESHDAEIFASANLVVVSPGVPPLAVLDQVEARGVEVIAEVELAARLLSGVLVGITGTNGKSTVTTLVGDMLRRSGYPTFVGGNLGCALSDAVGGDADTPEGRIVAELSSFQLERVVELRPRVAVLLNLSPDHLDRYDNVADYTRAKARIFDAQREGDHALVPANDPACRALRPRRAGLEVHEFGASGEVCVRAEAIVDEVTGWRFPLAGLALEGRHNHTNACAAVLAARLAGASGEAMAASLREVKGLPHRAEIVRTLDGVLYVDDSKATNVGATVAALEGLASPTRRAVLILGGVDKGGSYMPLSERFLEVGRAAVLIGEAAPLIAAALEGLGLPVERAASMGDAVAAARQLAEPGDLVLLSPGCSSYDMYRSYAHRGDVFSAAVRALEGGRR